MDLEEARTGLRLLGPGQNQQEYVSDSGESKREWQMQTAKVDHCAQQIKLLAAMCTPAFPTESLK